MPVQTRQQATQAANQLPHSHYTGDSASNRLLPTGGLLGLPESGMLPSQLCHDQHDRVRANANTPQTAGRCVRRRICEASHSDEQMVADMQAFEQQMVEGYQDYLGCPAKFNDAEAAAHQRNLFSLQREAEALEDAEAKMQQDLEVAAEIAELELCSEHLQLAADLVMKPSRFQALSLTDLNKMISAANHVVSVCQHAKAATQQAEVENLRESIQSMEQEVQHLQALTQEEHLQCLELRQSNRYVQQLRVRMIILAKHAGEGSSICLVVGHFIRQEPSCWCAWTLKLRNSAAAFV